ncbi:MAG TPA: DUF6311 domain-containing protein [Acetobacteraceae bacterium]|jgi:hypothetical protein
MPIAHPSANNAASGPSTMASQRPNDRPAIDTATACLLAGCIGLAYAMLVLGPAFFNQGSVYWQRPVGLAGGDFDLKTNLSGYYWIVQDSWRWPLLWLPHVDTPAGMNAYQFDSMPGLALLAKVLRSLSLGTINLYPEWIVGTFVVNAIALTLLVRALGRRDLLACIASAGFGVLAPIVHYRYGHSALMAQFFPVLALALYFQTRKPATNVPRHLAALLILCFVIATLNLYMYVMTAAIAAAAMIQLTLDRRLGVVGCIASFAGLLLVAFVPVWSFGALADPNLRAATVPFGYNSMNMMSPFWPQSSGLFRWTGVFYLTRGLIGATPGQWEGYDYLGAGALLLIALALMLRLRALPGQLRRHWVLAAALLVLTIWAISDRVYFGPVLLAAYPVPHVLDDTVLAWFRASGRLFWPVGWMLTAFGIAGVLIALRPRVALGVTIVALLLQWTDVSYLRHRIEAAVHTPAPSEFGSQAVADRIASEIAAHGRLVVLPAFYCRPESAIGRNHALDVADLEAEFMAARANVDVRHPKGSRPSYQCTDDREEDVAQLAGNGVLLDLPTGGPEDRTADARRELSCWQANVAWVCTAKPAATH